MQSAKMMKSSTSASAMSKQASPVSATAKQLSQQHHQRCEFKAQAHAIKQGFSRQQTSPATNCRQVLASRQTTPCAAQSEATEAGDGGPAAGGHYHHHHRYYYPHRRPHRQRPHQHHDQPQHQDAPKPAAANKNRRDPIDEFFAEIGIATPVVPAKGAVKKTPNEPKSNPTVYRPEFSNAGPAAKTSRLDSGVSASAAMTASTATAFAATNSLMSHQSESRNT